MLAAGNTKSTGSSWDLLALQMLPLVSCNLWCCAGDASEQVLLPAAEAHAAHGLL